MRRALCRRLAAEHRACRQQRAEYRTPNPPIVMGSEIKQVVHVLPAFLSALCSLMASSTFISILDHERWMKDWGEEHEAVSVLHMRMPIFSAAIMMGIGGIMTVHHETLGSIKLENEEHGASVLLTILAGCVAVATMFTMLYIARKDAFAGVGRVDCLKGSIMKKYTIAEIKSNKGLALRMAYGGKLEHVLGAGIVFGTGLFTCWSIHVAGVTGDFYIGWRAWPIASLAVSLLALSVISSWLLFRLLVWKPANEAFRVLCAMFLALNVWLIDYLGFAYAIRYEDLNDRTPQGNVGPSLTAGLASSQLLLVLLAFGAVITQYAITLELRVAYCGLQDENFDLQVMTGPGGADAGIPSTVNSMRRKSNHGNRTPTRLKRRTSTSPTGTVDSPGGVGMGAVVTAATTTGGTAAEGSSSSFRKVGRAVSKIVRVDSTNKMKSSTLKSNSNVVSAMCRMGTSSSRLPLETTRSIRVQPEDQAKSEAYKPTTGEVDEEGLAAAGDYRSPKASDPSGAIRPQTGGTGEVSPPPPMLKLPPHSR